MAPRPAIPRAATTLLAMLVVTGGTACHHIAPFFREEPAPRLLSEIPSANLAPPEGVRAASGEYRLIPLKWDPVLSGDIAGYVIEYAEERDGPFERLAIIEGRGTLGHLDGAGDTGIGDGITRFYRLRTLDESGHLSADASALVVATTAPLPSPPDGIQAYSHQPREIPLSWRPPDGQAVAGYVVERSPTREGRYEVVAELDGRHTTSHVDAGLGDLRVFFYAVRATNPGGAVGPASPPVRAVTKPVPLPPLDLRVALQRLGENVLEWEPNLEKDLAEYRLLRLPPGGEPIEVASVPADTTRAVDDTVGASEAVTYGVRAIDRDGLESIPSLPTRVQSEGYGLRAALVPSGLRLEWNPRADEGYVDALIERSSWLARTRVHRAENGVLIDEEVVPGRRYEYVVTLERVDGSRAPASQPISIDVPESATFH